MGGRSSSRTEQRETNQSHTHADYSVDNSYTDNSVSTTDIDSSYNDSSTSADTFDSSYNDSSNTDIDNSYSDSSNTAIDNSYSDSSTSADTYDSSYNDNSSTSSADTFDSSYTDNSTSSIDNSYSDSSSYSSSESYTDNSNYHHDSSYTDNSVVNYIDAGSVAMAENVSISALNAMQNNSALLNDTYATFAEMTEAATDSALEVASNISTDDDTQAIQATIKYLALAGGAVGVAMAFRGKK